MFVPKFHRAFRCPTFLQLEDLDMAFRSRLRHHFFTSVGLRAVVPFYRTSGHETSRRHPLRTRSPCYEGSPRPTNPGT
ncbi:hypothetical protein M413DRAFT_178216 [Hebeloma cylindrosporum]|uniref:Uncharacterized protein n=1 Tax=Hebeloma cylindrosporum TaxID=76867 RepID=A0A0C3C9U9_HEBCY|nr:hypothetical protein M413DRAFT_178216 [Hebeloma cylindrosporum h7]